MTTDRTEEGVRVRVKAGIRAAGRTGTALYGPYKRVGETWPGFGHRDDGWTLPVLLDGDDGPCLYSPSELEPGPPRPVHAPRRVRHLWSGREGSALVQETIDGVIWPGWDATGSWRIPVEVDGEVTTWNVRQIREPDTAPEPEPSPAQVPGEPPYGPRVRVRDRVGRRHDRGRVLYRAMASGRVWPDFDRGEWRVPVRMEATGATLFILAKDLEPFAEPERGPVARALFDQAETEAIQARALRDVAGAAADALELFASRLRDIELDGGER